jgi:hypothetical protein
MKRFFYISVTLSLILVLYYNGRFRVYNAHNIALLSRDYFNPPGKTILERIIVPDGFERIPLDENSFGYYLRNLPVKPHGTEIHLYDGQIKENKVHAAVIDMDIGYQDLQQCADAIIRLRSEYLYARKLYGLIHFNFTSGFRADYAKWALGYRINVKGNDVKWVHSENLSYDYNVFRQYLNVVFTYAGTYSLAQEMESISYKEIQPGDVFIHGGSPGHAVIVVDVAKNKSNDRKIFLLAQSYMPAQDIHILINPSDPDLSPWYELNPDDNVILTPEWDFNADEVKRFK